MKITKLKTLIIVIVLLCPVLSFSYYIALAIPINFDWHTNIEINSLVKERNHLLFGIPITNNTYLELTAQYNQGETEKDDVSNGNGITKYYRYQYLLGGNLTYYFYNKLEQKQSNFYTGIGYNIVGILENTRNTNNVNPDQMDGSGKTIFAAAHMIFGYSFEVFRNSFIDLRTEIPVIKIKYEDNREDQNVDFFAEFNKNYIIPIKFIYRYVF